MSAPPASVAAASQAGATATGTRNPYPASYPKEREAWWVARVEALMARIAELTAHTGPPGH